MKIRVNPHNVEIVKEQTEPINELEIKVSKCEFEFDEAITSDFVKEAYFTLNGNTYKQIIVNNECDYPSEVLTEKGTLEIGVVAFKVENDEEIVRYNPSPDYFESWVGSLKDAENSEPITPSEMEQFEQELQNGLNQVANVDIDAGKVGNVATVTITNRYGEEKSVSIYDGEKGDKGDKGDKGEKGDKGDKGDKGEPGAINLLIVNELPLVGSEDTLYFVPKEDTEESDMYDEYVWINNDWELVGTKQITVDLSDYVKNTDYATSNKGGVIKTGHQFTLDENNKAQCNTYNYSNYNNAENNTFVSKGTLENVITGKDLTTKAYVDGLVGDIGTILDNINGEVIGG